MLRAGGSISASGAGGAGASRQRVSSDLQGALEQLSQSLERIQGLLVELQDSGRPRSADMATRHYAAAGNRDQRLPSDETHVIRGAGPSVFARPSVGA